MTIPAPPDMPVAPAAGEPVPGYAAQIAALEDRVSDLEDKLHATPLERTIVGTVETVALDVAKSPLGLRHGLIVPLVIAVLTVIAIVVLGATNNLSSNATAEDIIAVVISYLGAHGLANIGDKALGNKL